MKLGERQEAFSESMTLLLVHLHALGYSLRGGHWLRCENCYIGHKHSNHKLKLAFDLNLTLTPAPGERSRLLTGKAAEKAHNILHDYWDTLGGARRIKGDLSHYSFEWRGMR